MAGPRVRISIRICLACSLMLSALFPYLLMRLEVFQPWTWRHEVLYAALTEFGALACVIVGLMLVMGMRPRTRRGRLFFPALGFVGLGLIEGMGAAVRIGDGMIYMHTSSGLVGGFCFALVALPARWTAAVLPYRRAVFGLTALLCLCFGALYLGVMHRLSPWNGIVYVTPEAAWGNTAAGALFLVAAMAFLLQALREDSWDATWFFCLALMLGSAWSAFPFSKPWDAAWWTWTFIRFAAFLLVFCAVLYRHADMVRQLRISNRRVQEANRALSLTRYALDHGFDMTFFVTADGGIVDVNHAACDRLGYSREDLLALSVFQIDADTDAARWSEIWNRLKREGVEVTFSHLRTRDGRVFPVEVASSHFVFEGVGHVFSAVRDITERVQAEEAFRNSELKYRKLLENLPQKVFYKDLDHRYVAVNRSFAGDFGLEPEEFIGKTDYDLFPPDLAARYQEGDVHVLNTGHTEEFDEQYLHEHKEAIVHTVKAPIYGEDGNVAGLLGIFWDITERKRAEEALARSNRELEQFAYVASHDLQEPLRGVVGFLELLQHRFGAQLNEDAARYIERALSAAMRMRSLISDLLAYSRVSTQGRPFESVDTNRVLEVVQEDLRSTIEATGARVLAESLPRVNGDPTQLRQLFQNLVSNGIKFHSAAPPLVHVTAHRGDHFWRFSVKDNGIGIDPKYAERVFVIFQRLHGRSEYPGTGIGLAVCKRIVERHGGRIWLESAPGQGATFHFTIADEGDLP